MKWIEYLKVLLFKYFFLISLLIGFSACEYEFVQVSQIDEPVSFSRDILPVFSQNGCLNCHRKGGTSPDLSPESAYSSIVPALVNLNNPEQSKIYMTPNPSSGHPGKFTPLQAAKVLAWIKQGALNN